VRLLYYCRLQTTYTFLQLCPCFNHTFHHTTPVNRVKFALLLNQFRNYLEAKYIFKLFARARARPGPYSRTLSIIIKNAHRQHTTKPNQTKPGQHEQPSSQAYCSQHRNQLSIGHRLHVGIPRDREERNYIRRQTHHGKCQQYEIVLVLRHMPPAALSNLYSQI
jgi:hypothetical protein